MATRKRMILEEIEEQNPLVPGSPDNPIKLGNKQKDTLLAIYMAARENRHLNRKDHFGWNDANAIFERLLFLGLIEETERITGTERQKLQAKIRKTRQDIASKAELATTVELYALVNTISDCQQMLNRRVVVPTKAGENLLLKGKVTLSL